MIANLPFHRSTISIAVLVCLAACGGGGNDTEISASVSDLAVSAVANDEFDADDIIIEAPTKGKAICTADRIDDFPVSNPASAGVKHQFYKITVVDSVTTAPISGAVITTTGGSTYTSDSNGNIAFYEPGMMGRAVFFNSKRSGYTMPQDMYGVRGTRLSATEGGNGQIKLILTDPALALEAGASTRVAQTQLLTKNVPGRAECMALQVVDSITNRGVPLVNVTTPVGNFITDSQGIAAYCDAENMGSAALQLSSHGYESSSQTVNLQPGESATLKLSRQNVAERLYRTTGQGTYRDSLLLGLSIPTDNGSLNAGVTGQDSVISAVYKNKVFWTWGDTNSAAYGLGNFATSGALSDLPGQGGLDPSKGINFNYYVNRDGFSKGMIPNIVPAIIAPTWMGGLVAVKDKSGNERLFGTYYKIGVEKGLAEFDDASQIFKSVLTYDLKQTGVPAGGQAITVQSGGKDWVQFPDNLRIPATAESMTNRASYQVFSPWLDASGTQLDVVNGNVNYAWRADTNGRGLSQDDVKKLSISPTQTIEGQLRDIGSSMNFRSASTAVSWNPSLGRFVAIITPYLGSGETWYSVADTPMGPWVYARKIISHKDYTFYNPYQHPYLSTDQGRTLYFEATYTNTYTKTAPTPLYNYNQMMYRVRTDDPVLALPVPVYELNKKMPGQFVWRTGVGGDSIAASFMAPNQAAPDTIKFGWDGTGIGKRKLVSGASIKKFAFYALPADIAKKPPNTVPLYGFSHADGRHAYSIDSTWTASGFVRDATPVAYVWQNPVQVKMPVGDYKSLKRVANASAASKC